MRVAIPVLLSLSLTAAPVSAQDLPTQYSALYGGGGGTSFSRDCGAGRLLAGVRGREGMLVDAIGLTCRQVLADGRLGSPSATGTLAGGSGGTGADATCPERAPVATGLVVTAGTWVDYVVVLCGTWNAATRSWTRAADVFTSIGSGRGGQRSEFNCGNRKQPMSGIRGRASALVDAVGAMCDEP